MYLTATRLDLMFAVSLISRYMESPTELHYQTDKRVLHYLKGTTDLGLFYNKETRNKKEARGELMGFSDSDYVDDLNDRKSTSGYVFMLSSAAVSWSSKKQPVFTLSTTEAEFIAATSSACQAVWLRRLLEELCFKQDKPTVIFYDKSSAIKLSRNPVMHGRRKHIDVRFHFLRDLVKNEVIELEHCPSNMQPPLFPHPTSNCPHKFEGIVRPPPPQPILPGQEGPQVGFGPLAQEKQPGQALGPTSPSKPNGRSCLGFSTKEVTSR
ncbi:hypothetical protein L3X38_027453 [Prunus dulcis]|uniref:Uncharacterized protein n=1 Tax=Prunus dulcis TaxID=3755 RepID=A0AAD4YZH4_PRUDU|nr:hypothetical protein L3X38_027453 [Prunus dulcis]